MTELQSPPGLLGLYARAVRPGGHRGDTLPDTVLTLAPQSIDADHLARYQQVCGLRVSHALPPTYLHVLAFPVAVALMTQRSFPLPLVGLVHVHNTITVARPVDSGEQASFRVRAVDLRPHRSGRQFDVVAEASVGAELVWTARSTYLRREHKPAQRPDRPPTEAGATPTAQVRVPADIGRRYAAVSGDRNPIHLSKLSAKAFGFPRAIAHGMWLAARTLAVLEGRLPDAATIDIAFKAPVLLPSTIGISAARVEGGWDLDVRNVRSGRPHLTGSVR